MSSALSHAVLQSELVSVPALASDWGTVGAGVNRYVPLSSFGLKADVETREQKPSCGVLDVRHVEKVRRTVQGSISSALYGFFAAGASDSLAQYLIAWAFGSPGTADRLSKTLHWKDAVSQGQFTGLRVNEATLTGEESGAIRLQLSLIGKLEEASVLALTLPNDRGKLTEFLFSDLALTVDGSALPIESFSWTIKHGLALKFNGDLTPSSLKATTAAQTLTLKPLKTSDAYAVLQRLGTVAIQTASLTLKGRHEGSGASGVYAQGVFAFNRLALLDHNEDVSVEDYNFQPLSFSCLKPASATAAVTQTWSLVS